MNTSTVYYVGGVILLGLPLFRLLGRPFRAQEFDRVMASGRLRRNFWRAPWQGLDFARAWAGAWLVQQSVALGGGPLDLSWLPPVWLIVTAVALAVTSLQVLASAQPPGVPLPLGFVTGLAIGLLPPMVAVPVVVMAFMSLLAMQSPHAFCVVGTAAAVAFAIFSGAGVSTAIKGVAIFAMPTAVALLLPNTQLWVLVPVREASAARVRAMQLEEQTSDLKL